MPRSAAAVDSQFDKLWLAIPLAAYVLLPTHNYYWDGVAFAINAEKDLPLGEILHPNHLIYTLVHNWIFHAVYAAGLHVRALYVMQFVNSMLAAACAPLMYAAVFRRTNEHAISIAGALLFAFAATWWRFATDSDAYIPSIFFLLCALHFLETRAHPAPAALCHAAAMLFHQLAILFLPFALFRLRDRRKALVYTAASLLPVGAAYIAAYRIVSGSFGAGGFLGWITSHSGESGFSFQPLRDLGHTLLGTVQLFFGGKLSAARGLPVPSVIALTILTALVVWRFRKAIPWRISRPPNDLLLWIAAYAVFLFFWMPQNTFYRLFYLVPMVLLICSTAPRLTLLCAAAFLWNGFFLVYPASRVQNNVPLRFALQQSVRWPVGTPIVFSNFHSDLWVISYFTPQVSWIGMPRVDTPVLDRAYDDATRRHQIMWLEASAFDTLRADVAGRAWLESHPIGDVLRFSDGKHSFTFYQLRPRLAPQ